MLKNLSLTIGYLYGDLMNIYGDTGNILTLEKRCNWRGIKTQTKNISLGDSLKPNDIDIYFFGGGQDQSQVEVAKDLQKKAGVIKKEVQKGIPLLSICGGYQLLGQYYRPQNGPKLAGIGLFQAYTLASNQRMIGNIVIKSEFGDLVGFENHSGKTYLEKGSAPFGTVIKGFGNNGGDKTEGCIYKNAIGCYMHGSLLPKNPVLADWLIQKALEVKYSKKIILKPLNDELENTAHTKTIQRLS
jgi:lipid II isoglutaminyl synthase (glutamine-hydrolysing)